MRIAVLTSGILPVPAVRGGAVESLIDSYIEYNERHRLHDITVYSVSAAGCGPVERLGRRLYHWLHRQEEYYHYSIEYFLHRSLQDLRRHDYDVVVLENRPGYAPKVRRVTGARIVCHLHNDFLNATTPQAEAIYRCCDRIVCVSDYIASRVGTIQPDDGKCVTVHNGIDLQAFSRVSAGPRSLAQERVAEVTAPTPLTLIFCGRLIPEKGILPLIHAVRLLRGRVSVRLLVVGGGALGDATSVTPFQRQLHEAARGLDNIEFTGYVSPQRMCQLMSEADVAVLPSLWAEPFGLTCAEALAAGLPLITTRRGGIPEVADERCAILLDADGDAPLQPDAANSLPRRIAAAISSLHAHPERLRAMAQAARQRAQLFSKERYARDFLQALSF